jgi:hypothetical protein
MDFIEPENSERILSPDDSEELRETREVWEVPEDRFCRKIAEDTIITIDLFCYYIDSRIARNIDVNNLKPARTNFFGTSKDDPFRELRLDIPYTSRLVDDQLDYEVLFVIEHKSSPNDFVFLQIYPYMDLSNLDKWKRAGHPKSRKTFRPYITLAVLLYCGEDKSDDVQYYQDMFPGLPDELREFVPQSKIIRANLNNFSYDNLPGHPETRAVVETIKRIHDGTMVEHFGDIIGNFRNMTWDDRIIEIVHSICFYTASHEQIDSEYIQKTIQKTIPGKEGEDMANAMKRTLYDEISEKGEAKFGREAVLDVLCKRFKITNVPKGIEAAIQRMNDPIALKSLHSYALDCQTLDEFAEALN